VGLIGIFFCFLFGIQPDSDKQYNRGKWMEYSRDWRPIRTEEASGPMDVLSASGSGKSYRILFHSRPPYYQIQIKEGA
jgi:hypothetical protein